MQGYIKYEYGQKVTVKIPESEKRRIRRRPDFPDLDRPFSIEGEEKYHQALRERLFPEFTLW